MQESIPAQLFLDVNPALGTVIASCDGHLENGKAYCVGPNYDWKNPLSENGQDPTDPEDSASVYTNNFDDDSMTGLSVYGGDYKA